MRLKDIDYHRPPIGCEATHNRLLNWGRWLRAAGGSDNTHPLFKLYEPGIVERKDIYKQVETDPLDAWKVEQVVRVIGEPYRSVVRWGYVFCSPVNKICKKLGTRPQELGLWLKIGVKAVDDCLPDQESPL